MHMHIHNKTQEYSTPARGNLDQDVIDDSEVFGVLIRFDLIIRYETTRPSPYNAIMVVNLSILHYVYWIMDITSRSRCIDSFQ
ncbi:hypothetical protein O181_066120 [Austropuccinia psidii MF-1]|uniref:Uncharacterized protein n=1 Tax=Austropuccinia psidii MF-1 TaxID=1389203 RepID=A0A9Q3I4S7_9BASI|nr:hypothetical protein [Austropuccinia psidii MF-1]